MASTPQIKECDLSQNNLTAVPARLFSCAQARPRAFVQTPRVGGEPAPGRPIVCAGSGSICCDRLFICFARWFCARASGFRVARARSRQGRQALRCAALRLGAGLGWSLFPRLRVRSFVCLFVCAFVCLFVCPFVFRLARFVCLFVCVFSRLRVGSIGPAPRVPRSSRRLRLRRTSSKCFQPPSARRAKTAAAFVPSAPGLMALTPCDICAGPDR